MDELTIRRATVADVDAIVAMLADDPLGSGREDPADRAPYLAAFAAIERDPNQLLVVAERDTAVVATLQLTFVPGLSRRGATRAIIEAVRVSSAARGSGIGGQLVQWAIEQAGERGAAVVQLTTDRARVDAHRFYERLGFEATHLGLKRRL